MVQFDSRLEKLESLLNRVLEIVQSKGKFLYIDALNEQHLAEIVRKRTLRRRRGETMGRRYDAP